MNTFFEEKSSQNVCRFKKNRYLCIAFERDANMVAVVQLVSAFLKCGEKIGIIFNIAKNETKIFEISALFFLLVDTYIVLLEQLSRAFDKDFQVFTSFRR